MSGFGNNTLNIFVRYEGEKKKLLKDLFGLGFVRVIVATVDIEWPECYVHLSDSGV